MSLTALPRLMFPRSDGPSLRGPLPNTGGEGGGLAFVSSAVALVLPDHAFGDALRLE